MIRHEIRKEDMKAWDKFKIQLAIIVVAVAVVSFYCLSR